MKKTALLHTIQLAAFLFSVLCILSPPIHASNSILVQSTTSTANSGLYDHLLPLFEANSGIKVNVVAVGTGQAIKNAMNCDADVLLVHAKSAEEAFVAAGHGLKRHDLMFNDFVFVGPKADPAGIAGSNNAVESLQKIAESGAKFASRGDNSGTHKKELSLWASADIAIKDAPASWYLSTGSGMGATLNTAVGLGAYTISDRATWISFKNKGDFEIVTQADDALFNQYGVIVVNPTACPSVNAAGAQAFVDWLLSEDGQLAIAGFTVDEQQLFFPSAL